MPSTSRYYGVQALRGFAALLVVAYHATKMIRDRIDPLFGLFPAGGAGVDVFFAISGFVIVITASPDAETPESWSVFLWRRLARIVPLYWLLTTLKLITLLASPALAQHSGIHAWHLAASYLFIPAWNVEHEPFPLLTVGWTLSYEMLFYLLFTGALALKAQPVGWISALLLALSFIGLWRADSWGAPATLLNPVLLEFIFGMWIARATRAGWRIPLKLACCLVPAMALFIMATNMLPPGLCLQYRLFFWGIPGALLVFASIALEERFHSVLRGFPALLGNASYAIYLVHGFILPFIGIVFLKLSRHGAPFNDVVVITGVTGSVIAGIAVHLQLEKPLNRRLRGLFARHGHAADTGV
jgi:peptidoglycan/LPS O-acetylase OafA/YrhL